MNSSLSNCTELDMPNVTYFFECYGVFIKENVLLTIFHLLFALVTVALCLIVIALICRKKQQNIFDKILLATLFTHTITSGIDWPIYHIYSLFNYWPFGKSLCIFWCTLDSTINSMLISNTFFLSWVRLISVLRPKKYSRHFYARKPLTCIFTMWSIGFIIWFFTVYFYISNDYVPGSCGIVFKPAYLEQIYYFVILLLPVMMVIFFAIYTMKIIHNRVSIEHKNSTKDSVSYTRTENTNSIEMNPLNKKRLKPVLKLLLIIVFFIIEWFPSLIVMIIQSFCACLPFEMTKFFYFLTFTGSLSDPIIILALNSRYKLANENEM